jgi:hypothetical protein
MINKTVNGDMKVILTVTRIIKTIKFNIIFAAHNYLISILAA